MKKIVKITGKFDRVKAGKRFSRRIFAESKTGTFPHKDKSKYVRKAKHPRPHNE